jgi:hypothetical protein
MTKLKCECNKQKHWANKVPHTAQTAKFQRYVPKINVRTVKTVFLKMALGLMRTDFKFAFIDCIQNRLYTNGPLPYRPLFVVEGWASVLCLTHKQGTCDQFWRPNYSADWAFISRQRVEILKKYRVSQEECEILRESVPYVKLYRYNPKHLYPKLDGYGDNYHRKMWASGESTYCSRPW